MCACVRVTCGRDCTTRPPRVKKSAIKTTPNGCFRYSTCCEPNAKKPFLATLLLRDTVPIRLGPRWLRQPGAPADIYHTIPYHGCCYRRHNRTRPVLGTSFICAVEVSCIHTITASCLPSLNIIGWSSVALFAPTEELIYAGAGVYTCLCALPCPALPTRLQRSCSRNQMARGRSSSTTC